MLCFFITAFKASIFLKHLDSIWPYRLQKLQCLSVFFPLFWFALLFWWFDFSVCGWNCWGPLFGLGPYFLGYCFLGFFWYGCCWATKAFLEVFPAVIRPRCKSFFLFSYQRITKGIKRGILVGGSWRNDDFSSGMEGGNKYRVCRAKLSKNEIDEATIILFDLTTFYSNSEGLEFGQTNFNGGEIIGVQSKQLIFKLVGLDLILNAKNII